MLRQVVSRFALPAFEKDLSKALQHQFSVLAKECQPALRAATPKVHNNHPSSFQTPFVATPSTTRQVHA